MDCRSAKGEKKSPTRENREGAQAGEIAQENTEEGEARLNFDQIQYIRIVLILSFPQQPENIWSSVRETLAMEESLNETVREKLEISRTSSTVTVASKTGIIPPKPMMIPGRV